MREMAEGENLWREECLSKLRGETACQKSLRKFTGKMNCVVRGKAPEEDLEGGVLSKREGGRQGRETLSQSGGKG